MTRILLVLAALLAGLSTSQAQNCRYQASAPTLVNGGFGNLQCDINGALKIAGTISANSVATATAAAPSYMEGASNAPLSVDLSGNLRVLAAFTALYSGAPGAAVPAQVSATGLSDGTNSTRWIQAANALNSTGVGIGTSQIVAQFDDVAPTSITENQFGNARMSANRNLYGTIRDGASGAERGAGVNASNELLVALSSVPSHAVTNAGTFATQSSIPTWAGGTLGAMANYGTSPGAVLVPGVNAFITNANANGQATMANSAPVVIASNQASIPVASTLGAETTKVIGVTRQADGSGNLMVGDACQLNAKTYTPISITTATTTRIVAPTSAKKTYICYLLLTSAAADNVGIVEGTGGTCGTGTAGVIGGTTAANGPNFAANGGFAGGNGGFAIAATAGTNVDLCLITSAATPLAGVIAWVAQ